VRWHCQWADRKRAYGRTAIRRGTGFENTTLEFRAQQGNGNGGTWVEVNGSRSRETSEVNSHECSEELTGTENRCPIALRLGAAGADWGDLQGIHRGCWYAPAIRSPMGPARHSPDRLNERVNNGPLIVRLGCHGCLGLTGLKLPLEAAGASVGWEAGNHQ
jgi:hypothetical protein